AGAKEVTVAGGSVEKASVHTDNFGTKGTAEVDNAKIDAVDVKDGHAGLRVDGKEVVGVSGSANVGGGVEQAKADYDLSKGQASAEVKNASAGFNVNGAKLNVGGNESNLPDVGAKVNASASGKVDLSEGQVQGSASLAGSSFNIGDSKFTLPEEAQASGGVKLSEGAVNANLGGKNGVGVDVNLSK